MASIAFLALLVHLLGHWTGASEVEASVQQKGLMCTTPFKNVLVEAKKWKKVYQFRCDFTMVYNNDEVYFTKSTVVCKCSDCSKEPKNMFAEVNLKGQDGLEFTVAVKFGRSAILFATVEGANCNKEPKPPGECPCTADMKALEASVASMRDMIANLTAALAKNDAAISSHTSDISANAAAISKITSPHSSPSKPFTTKSPIPSPSKASPMKSPSRESTSPASPELKSMSVRIPRMKTIQDVSQDLTPELDVVSETPENTDQTVDVSEGEIGLGGLKEDLKLTDEQLKNLSNAELMKWIKKAKEFEDKMFNQLELNINENYNTFNTTHLKQIVISTHTSDISKNSADGASSS